MRLTTATTYRSDEMRVLSDAVVTARKEHFCDACEAFNRAGYGLNEFDDANEVETIKNCEKDGYKINPKTKYRRLVYNDSGDLVVFKARLDMDSICQKYGFYEE